MFSPSKACECVCSHTHIHVGLIHPSDKCLFIWDNGPKFKGSLERLAKQISCSDELSMEKVIHEYLQPLHKITFLR